MMEDWRIQQGKSIDRGSVEWGGARLRFDRPAPHGRRTRFETESEEDMFAELVDLPAPEPLWQQYLPYLLGGAGVLALVYLWRR